MKVDEILVEVERADDTDCVRGIVMNTFDERYTELAAVMGLDLEDIKQFIESQNSRDLAPAGMVIDDLISMQANDDLHIRRDENVHAQLDALEQSLDAGENKSQAILELTNFLKSHLVTLDTWAETQEGQETIADAMEQCEDQANPHAARGVSPSDF